MTWARTLNREFAVPLPDSEVRGIWRSVCRYRARWRVQGHQQGWLWKQAARGRKGVLPGAPQDGGGAIEGLGGRQKGGLGRGLIHGDIGDDNILYRAL